MNTQLLYDLTGGAKGISVRFCESTDIESIRSELAGKGVSVLEIDGVDVKSIDDLFRAVAIAFRKPKGWYGDDEFVSIRARVKNGLQHLMLNRGVQLKQKLWNEEGQKVLRELPLEGWAARRGAEDGARRLGKREDVFHFRTAAAAGCSHGRSWSQSRPDRWMVKRCFTAVD
jgi:hypothetical protein